MADNLKILHAQVGTWTINSVIPAYAVEGGSTEIDRLIKLKAVEWTDAEVTEPLAASNSAVMEMDDDELVKENKRLKRELEALKAGQPVPDPDAVKKADEKAVEAAKKADADKGGQAAGLKLGEPDNAKPKK